MILGIGGFTALLVTGFGLKDSIAGFAETQYNDIQVADASANLRNVGAELPEELTEVLAENTEDYTLLIRERGICCTARRSRASP